MVIFVGGQPGAGKTRAGADEVAATGQRVVALIGDDLRVHHPKYREFLNLPEPNAMPDGTIQASGRWVEMGVDHAIAHRLSVLVEGTFRDPNTPLRTAQKFKDAGYRVRAVVVAVAPEVSRASAAGRYLEDLAGGKEARFTALDAHDAAVKGMKRTVTALSRRDAPVDTLVVRSRTGVLFEIDRQPGRAIRGAWDAVKAEWDRKLNRAEYTNWQHTFQAVKRTIVAAAVTLAKGFEKFAAQLDKDDHWLYRVQRGTHTGACGAPTTRNRPCTRRGRCPYHG